MTNPKRHHYIAEMHQKRFADAGGWLHTYSKNQPRRGITRTRPINLFVEGHRYSAYRKDGSRDPALEQRLSTLETQVDPILGRIVDAARRNETPGLTAAEQELWFAYFVIQWKRVPDLHLTITTDAEAEADVRRIIAELREIFPHRRAELDAMVVPEALKRILQNGRVNSLETVSSELLSALRSRGLGIVRSAPKKRFVLGSRPVTKFSLPGEGHIMNPEVEMWLPIADDVAVGLGAASGSERLFSATADQVRYINLTTLKQSTIIASASPTLIRSLLRNR